MAVGNVSSTKHHQQIVKMMVAVLGFFILLAGPWHMADIILDVGGEDGRPMPATTQLITREIASLLIFVNGWIIPIVYASFNSGVRYRVGEMLTCGSGRCQGLLCWNRVQPENAPEDDAGFNVQGTGHPAVGNVQTTTAPV